MEADTPSIERQIACVKREIAMRERVYPRWVDSGKLKQSVADDEINVMKAVLATLQAVKEAKEPKLI